MEIKTSLKHLRIAPRKVRLVADLIRGMNMEKAKVELQFSKKRAAKPLLKLLNSVVVDAGKNFDLDQKRIENLYIKKIIIDEGPKFKRWMPISRGSAHEIQKKTSHIILALEEKLKPKRSEQQKSNKKQVSNINN